jgi:hypothetical protein
MAVNYRQLNVEERSALAALRTFALAANWRFCDAQPAPLPLPRTIFSTSL